MENLHLHLEGQVADYRLVLALTERIGSIDIRTDMIAILLKETRAIGRAIMGIDLPLNRLIKRIDIA